MTPASLRICYIGHGVVLQALAEDFLRTGGTLVEKMPLTIFVPPALGKHIRVLKSLHFEQGQGAVVSFHSSLFHAVQYGHHHDADLMVVDERRSLPARKRRPEAVVYEFSGEEFTQPGTDEEVLRSVAGRLGRPPEHFEPTAEDFLKALALHAPSTHAHYPLRRVVIVLPEEARSSDRSFHLGHLGFRGALIGPKNTVELFEGVARQLYKNRNTVGKSALCVSGGGLEGYLYSVGVARALDRALKSHDCRSFDIYCGVSSGALLCSSLAGGVGTEDLVRQIYRLNGRLDPLSLGMIFDPAGGEIFKRLATFLKDFATHLDSTELVSRLQKLVPLGFFKGEKLRTFVASQLEKFGQKDRLSALSKELYISATDQDTGEHVLFGEEPWRDIPISQAVRASTALPPFYLPERIRGHWFTDGQVSSVADFSTAIRKGARLVIFVDPMIPFTSSEAGAVMNNGGYFGGLQALKTILHTRTQSLLRHAIDKNPDVDFVCFHPTDDVMRLMSGNPMKYRIRSELVELGARATWKQLLENHSAHEHRFAKHGFQLHSKAHLEKWLEDEF